MTKVSVIIPVYNVEKYIARCVDSVIRQTLSDIEIILVDDGSPDDCPRICDSYAETDSRVRVVHKKNGGLSSARNAGISVASGEYIFFLDSDDWIDPDGLMRLCTVADDNRVDIVRFRPFRSLWPDLPEDSPWYYGEDGELSSGLYTRDRIEREIFPLLLVTPSLSLSPIVSACSCLYRASFLANSDITFDESIKYSEDVLFSASVVAAAASLYYISDAGIYHYFYNPSSISKAFKPDRIEAAKALTSACEKHFSSFRSSCIRRQLPMLHWYCILNCLGDRRLIADKAQKRDFIKALLNDPFVKKAPLLLRGLKLSFRTRCLMLAIKLRFYRIIERN